MELGDVISGVALVVAIGTTLWQVSRSRFERPIVDVYAQATRFEAQGHPKWVMHAVVSNVGERPVTLLGVDWVVSQRRRDVLVRSGQLEPSSVTLPYRLEPYDSVPVAMTFLNMADLQADMTLRASALTVQRTTWWQRRRGRGSRRHVLGAPVVPLRLGTLTAVGTRVEAPREW